MTRRSDGLDAIRGVAIGLVLVWHLFYESLSGRFPVAGQFLILSWSGVDLFFVLSGFLIGGILIDNRDKSNLFLTFYARRAIRILPLYLVLTVPFAFITGASIFPYLTFTQNFLWASQGAWGPSATGATWSLAVEEQFYLLLPLIVWLCRPRSLPLILLLLICSAPLVRLALPRIYGNSFAPYFLLPGRMDALLLGVLGAWMLREKATRNWLLHNRGKLYALAALLLCPVAIMTYQQTYVLGYVLRAGGFTVIGLFYFVILLLVVTRARPEIPVIFQPLRWLGLGAYSLYLFHLPIYVILSRLTDHYISSITFLVCAGFSVLAWVLIERPMIAWGHARFKYARKDQASNTKPDGCVPVNTRLDPIT